MSSFLKSACSIAILLFVHLFANRIHILGWLWKGRFLSAAGGISVAYIFIDLLPDLNERQAVIASLTRGILPFAEHHVFIMALFGMITFYGEECLTKTATFSSSFKITFTMVNYLSLNFFIGYTIGSQPIKEIGSLAFFTLATALHHFIADHHLREKHEKFYHHKARWLISLSLVLGWFFGLYAEISIGVISLTLAFIAGGIIMNVFRHELPSAKPQNFASFTGGALVNTLLILISQTS